MQTHFSKYKGVFSARTEMSEHCISIKLSEPRLGIVRPRVLKKKENKAIEKEKLRTEDDKPDRRKRRDWRGKMKRKVREIKANLKN
jgi:hypothetical protein